MGARFSRVGRGESYSPRRQADVGNEITLLLNGRQVTGTGPNEMLECRHGWFSASLPTAFNALISDTRFEPRCGRQRTCASEYVHFR